MGGSNPSSSANKEVLTFGESKYMKMPILIYMISLVNDSILGRFDSDNLHNTKVVYMNINDTINKKHRHKLNILYKDYKNAWKIINDKQYEFLKYEKEYDNASAERRREISNLLPKDEDYKKADSLMNTLRKELSKRDLINFFTKNGLLDGSSVMFDS